MIQDLRAGQKLNAITDKKFGYSFAIFFFVFGIASWHYNWFQPVYAFAAALVFAAAAFWQPGLLKPLNKLWYWVGRILQFLISPIILGIMFFLVLLPIAAIRKIGGKSPIKKGFDREQKSYWLERNTVIQDTIFDHIF